LPDETLAGTKGQAYIATLGSKAITTLDGKAIVANSPKFSKLAKFMELPFPGATWHFTGSPQISSVKARRCTMQIPIGVRGYSSYSASLET
jgi:hypothetical protein